MTRSVMNSIVSGYGSAIAGVSQGRLPDGSGNFTLFPGTTSPGAANFIAAPNGLLINEVMTRNEGLVTDPFGGSADWLELYNPTTLAADLTGFRLSFDPSKPSWLFPTGTSIPAGGYLVL